MHSKITLFALLYLLVLFPGLQAQPFYGFSQSTGTYTELTGVTNLITNFTKDGDYYQLPAGFKLFGEPQGANLKVGRDGWTSAQTTTRFFAYDPFIVIGKKIVARSQTSAISAKTEVAGNDTIVKVQWKNVNVEGHGPSDFLNFQAWFYKSSQVVEFRYGPSNMTFDPTDTFSIPIVHFNDDFSTCYESHNIYGSGTTVQDDTAVNTTKVYSGTVPDGTIFRFTPVTTNISMVAEKAIVNVYPNPTSGIVMINVKNRATYTMTGITGMAISSGTVVGTCKIDITAQPKGIYLLQVGTEVIRLIKE